MIRTIIVDDELLAGVGIQSLIDGRDEIKVAAVLNSAEDAADFLRENLVDVVITDIEMGDMSGLDLIRVIREEQLAQGIIILSCHDDFSYAQDAISKGTDSYLLKHSVTEKILVDEIKKVYQKHQGQQLPGGKRSRPATRDLPRTGREIYSIGVLHITDYGNSRIDRENQMEKTMLVHLLENIVSHYQMGTLYAPYDREIFIVFQQDQAVPAQSRRDMVSCSLNTISRSLQQYISTSIYYGVSTEYTDSDQIHEKYDEAINAAEMRFYKPEQSVFFYQQPERAAVSASFSTERFWKPAGEDVFKAELTAYIHSACFHQTPARDMRAQLLHSVGRIFYQILQEHRFSEELMHKWSSDAALVSAVTSAETAQQLECRLAEIFGQFHRECLAELEGDGLSRILDYIEQNLDSKIQLVDLAEMGYMSVPTFSKKFKERTGVTLVQYLNERRIERAKVLLRNHKYSLDHIAAATGFSNANYLIRVFKKVTGKTISEYRE